MCVTSGSDMGVGADAMVSAARTLESLFSVFLVWQDAIETEMTIKARIDCLADKGLFIFSNVNFYDF